ncbi:MAG: hypothetical protein ACI8TF_002752 [Paracoccaceae bacterium]
MRADPRGDLYVDTLAVFGTTPKAVIFAPAKRETTVMSCIDGFITVRPTTDCESYTAFSEAFVDIIKECGANCVKDCWADDVPNGKVMSFPVVMKKTEDETVVFSVVFWPSKKAGKARNAAMRVDPLLAGWAQVTCRSTGCR